MAKFKVGDKVRIVTDIASSVIMQGDTSEVGLVEVVDGRPLYYLYDGDDWGFEEHEIEMVQPIGI